MVRWASVNVQGEQQQKLDVFANDLLTKTLGAMPHVAAIVSEEDEGPVVFERAAADEGEQFVVIFDPLDGSSNIDVNVNVGTIFSVVRMEGDAAASAMQAGDRAGGRGVCVVWAFGGDGDCSWRGLRALERCCVVHAG